MDQPARYTQLVRIGLEHPDIRFEIVYGVSNNKRSWYDNSNAYRLGYRPQDDSEPYAAEILAREAGQAKDAIAERYQGGTFPPGNTPPRRRPSSRRDGGGLSSTRKGPSARTARGSPGQYEEQGVARASPPRQGKRRRPRLILCAHQPLRGSCPNLQRNAVPLPIGG